MDDIDHIEKGPWIFKGAPVSRRVERWVDRYGHPPSSEKIAKWRKDRAEYLAKMTGLHADSNERQDEIWRICGRKSTEAHSRKWWGPHPTSPGSKVMGKMTLPATIDWHQDLEELQPWDEGYSEVILKKKPKPNSSVYTLRLQGRNVMVKLPLPVGVYNATDMFEVIVIQHRGTESVFSPSVRFEG